MDITNICKNDLLHIIEQCKSKSELLKYFGLKLNRKGYKILNVLSQVIGKDIDELINQREIDNIEKYNINPNTCEYCKCALNYSKRDNRFCSKECSINFINSNKKRKIAFCEECGKELDNIYSKFCNKECYLQSKRRKKEDKIQRWINGDLIINSTSIPRFIREYLLDKHNNKCELCGWGEKNIYSNTIPLEIHHIDGDCTNNHIDNLQVICPNCHSLTKTNGNLNKNSKRFHKKRINKREEVRSI